jgi:hypothetical protein
VNVATFTYPARYFTVLFTISYSFLYDSHISEDVHGGDAAAEADKHLFFDNSTALGEKSHAQLHLPVLLHSVRQSTLSLSKKRYATTVSLQPRLAFGMLAIGSAANR